MEAVIKKLINNNNSNRIHLNLRVFFSYVDYDVNTFHLKALAQRDDGPVTQSKVFVKIQKNKRTDVVVLNETAGKNTSYAYTT